MAQIYMYVSLLVSDLLDNGNAIVEDEDIDFFEIESNRLIIN